MKGAKCEGKSIPGLAKVRKYKYAQKDEAPSTEAETEIDSEEYILGKLLKKSLVNGAMKHDTIVDACKSSQRKCLHSPCTDEILCDKELFHCNKVMGV